MPRERFQPIPVKPPSQNRTLWRLRRFFDLQLCTIVKYLRPAMSSLQGRILDVGAGESPWKEYLREGCVYQGLDVKDAVEYGMSQRDDIVYYDGRVFPFATSTFDGAICIEVLEHVENPDQLLSEVSRVMKPGATLLLSVPWSARQHHNPHDYHRFSKENLAILLGRNGFIDLEIRERGNDVGVIASKLVVMAIRLFTPKNLVTAVWTLPLGLVIAACAGVMLVSFHISEYLGCGSRDDPLGYFVRATRAH